MSSITRRHAREDLADLGTALPVLSELERRSHQVARRAVGLDLRPGQRLAVVLDQHRLRIERIDVRHAAVQEQKDDALALWRGNAEPSARADPRSCACSTSISPSVPKPPPIVRRASRRFIRVLLIHRTELSRAQQHLHILRPGASRLGRETPSPSRSSSVIRLTTEQQSIRAPDPRRSHRLPSPAAPPSAFARRPTKLLFMK